MQKRTALAAVLAVAAAGAADAQVWYGLEFGSGELYRVDVGAGETTGTLIGLTGLSNTGLAFGSDGTLYAFENVTRMVYTVDIDTAEVTAIGPTGVGGSALAYDPIGDRFFTSTFGEIFSVDIDTGEVIFPPAINITPNQTLDGMTVLPVDAGGFDAGTIIGVFSTSLFAIDPVTGTLTDLGDTQGRSTVAAAPDGSLWLADETGGIWRRDLATGVETLAFEVDTGGGRIVASAFFIPAPGSGALLAAAGLAAARRRR